MPVYKDKNKGTWFVVVRYKDWTDKSKTTTKSGFKTQKEAKTYEADFNLRKTDSLNMKFEDFYKIYIQSMENRIRLNTIIQEKYVFENKILPYFGEKKLNEIEAKDVIKWQNTLLKTRDKNGNMFSQTYLNAVHNQLSALFNYACKFYGLKSNPARNAGNMEKEQSKEIKFWTKDEYLKFSRAIMDKDDSFHAFELLYWCGLRLSEMLSLTVKDFDFEKGTVRINKSLQRIHSEDIITDPKTAKGKRTVQMPDFLCDEMKDYIDRLYDIQPDDKIFTLNKHTMHHEMVKGCKLTGVKRIRIHDLRHSHASLLISLGEKPNHKRPLGTRRYRNHTRYIRTSIS